LRGRKRLKKSAIWNQCNRKRRRHRGGANKAVTCQDVTERRRGYAEEGKTLKGVNLRAGGEERIGDDKVTTGEKGKIEGTGRRGQVEKGRKVRKSPEGTTPGQDVPEKKTVEVAGKRCRPATPFEEGGGLKGLAGGRPDKKQTEIRD